MKRQTSLGLHSLLLATMCAVAATGFFSQRAAWAQEEAAVEETAEAEGEEPAEGEAEDPLAIPEGGADELQEHLRKVITLLRRPAGETPEEKKEFTMNALEAMTRTADKLLKAEASDEQIVEAHNYKIMALGALNSMDEATYGEKFEKAINLARKDEREGVQQAGWRGFLQLKLRGWNDLDEAGRNSVVKQIVAKVKKGPAPIDVRIVAMTAGALEHQDDEAVIKLLSETIPLFEASDNEEIKATLEESNLAGMTRRLSLMGNPMEITGTLLGGEEVDWESYRGKVVLVDFWATWCGPCRAEVPNILAMHKAYGAKGFDVLGVSLDETAEDAETYIEEQGIPWKSLFSDKEEERGWANPLARYYGINGIPTAILVDQEGKVVDMNARGERLQQRLQELLGDPVEAPADEAAEEPAEDAAASEEADADAAS